MPRFERLTVAAFNAGLTNGASYLDAIEQMSPALDTLISANGALGRTGGEAIAELLHFRRWPRRKGNRRDVPGASTKSCWPCRISAA